MVSSWTLDRARTTIESIFDTETDPDIARLLVLDQLRRAVGFAAYVWPLTDPATAVGNRPLAEVPCQDELTEAIRLKYLSRLNRWTSLSATGAGIGWLSQGTHGDYARSPLWDGLLRQYSVGDTASVVFADKFGCWGWLDLWREHEDLPFSDDDAGFLAAIAATVTSGLRHLQALSFDAVSTDDNDPARSADPSVTILSEQLVVQWASPGSAMAGQPAESAKGLRPMAEILQAAGQLLANDAGVDQHAPAARMLAGDRTWVRLQAGWLEGGSQGTRAIAVTASEAGFADRLEIFSRSEGLTVRERELLALVARGCDTVEASRRMSISTYTAQDHLKSVFTKTRCRSRAEVLGKILGHSSAV